METEFREFISQFAYESPVTQNADKKREQVQFLCMDDMVPQDHLLRIIDKAIDWNFIYDLVVEKYSQDNGRPSMDPALFEQIFSHILMECYKFKLVDPTEVFVDATHVKARANNKKMQKRIAHEEALFYEELLKKEINEDREAHGKKPLKEKNDKDDDDNDSTPSAGGDPKEFTDDIPKDTKTIKCSTTDPESGWFRKGEHKNVFAYAIETACDKNG